MPHIQLKLNWNKLRLAWDIMSLNNFQKLAKPSKWCATRQVDILNKGLRTT